MLSERQLQVARLLASGLTKAEVAGQMGLAVATVDNHTRLIYAKLGVKNAVQLTHWMVRGGYYTIPGMRGRPRKPKA